MAELETVTMRGWPKGLNLAADSTVVGADELLEATNVAYGPLGEIGIRKGALVSGVLGGTPDAGPQDWIWSWWPAEADEPQLVMVSRTEDEFHWTDLEGTALDTSPAALGTWQENHEYMWFPQGIVMLNKAYISVPSDDPTAFVLESGTGGDTLTEIDPWLASTNETDKFPAAGALLVAYDRVFAANLLTDASGLSKSVDRLFFSEELAPLNWKTTNFIDIGADQGQAITALRFFADQIIVFKEASIWGILGADFQGITNQVYMIDGGYGCTAPGTIVEAGNGLLFLDPARGVILYDGSQFHDIGASVFPAIREALITVENEDPAGQKCWAWMHENVYYLAIPEHGVYAFDIRIGAWAFHTWQPHCTTSFVMGGRSVVLGVGDAPDGNGYTWDMHLGNVDMNGTLVEVSAKTAWISPGTSALMHRLHATDITYFADDRSLHVTFHTDFDDAERASAEFSEFDGHRMVRTHANPGARWRAIQVHISSEGIT